MDAGYTGHLGGALTVTTWLPLLDRILSDEATEEHQNLCKKLGDELVQRQRILQWRLTRNCAEHVLRNVNTLDATSLDTTAPLPMPAHVLKVMQLVDPTLLQSHPSLA